MYLYIMRHGETDWNKQGLIQGSSDIDLNDYGRELAEKTRDGFASDGISFDRMYCSPLRRALETASIVDEKQKLPIIKEERIKEMSFGKYEGHSLKALAGSDPNLRNCFSRPSAYHPDPTGESFQHLLGRAADFLKEEILPLEQNPSVKNVLAVCHGAIIRAVLSVIRQKPLDDFWNDRQPNCSVNLISVENGKMEVVRENILYYPIKEWKPIL